MTRLQRIGEPLGIVIRHGWEHVNRSPVPHYNGDESYPSCYRDNAQSVGDRFRELYVVNCCTKDPRVTALPKGVTPHRHPWRLAWAQPCRRKTELAYCNFSLGNLTQPRYVEKREAVLQTLRNKSWLTFENVGNRFGTYDLTLLRYYQRVCQHRFTISPEGNGIDCHRTWEALYLKSIPIVQRSTEMSHFEDLPILFTDDYSELTPAYLNEQYARILDTDYRINKLNFSHWERLILDSISRCPPLRCAA